MVALFTNSGDPDQTRSAASDLGLYCLPNTLLGVSRLDYNGVIFTTSCVSAICRPLNVSLDFCYPHACMSEEYIYAQALCKI